MALKCPWPAICQCHHVGCTAGWLDLRRPDGTEYTSPCPNCRPELAEHLRNGRGSLAEVRGRIRHVPRPSRAPADSK
jgi:hypothetical protein